jgi:hypothetical protein
MEWPFQIGILCKSDQGNQRACCSIQQNRRSELFALESAERRRRNTENQFRRTPERKLRHIRLVPVRTRHEEARFADENQELKKPKKVTLMLHFLTDCTRN